MTSYIPPQPQVLPSPGSQAPEDLAHLNPRGATVIALEKPSEREQSQWYFQRYVTHLPGAGEIVMFDRSWSSGPAVRAEVRHSLPRALMAGLSLQ